MRAPLCTTRMANACSQTDGQAARYKRIDRQADGETDRQPARQTATDRQTDSLAGEPLALWLLLRHVLQGLLNLCA